MNPIAGQKRRMRMCSYFGGGSGSASAMHLCALEGQQMHIRSFSLTEVKAHMPTSLSVNSLLCDLLNHVCQPELVQKTIGDGPNTVSERVRLQTPNSVRFVRPHRVPGRELSELLSAYYLCAKTNSSNLTQNSPSLPQSLVSSLFQNSTLETVFHPFPRCWASSSHRSMCFRLWI